MSKFMSVLLALCMLFSVTACSTTNSENAAEESNKAVTAEEEAASEAEELTGTVTAVDGDNITIETEEGEEISFTLTEATVYTMDLDNMPLGDFTPDENAPEMSEGDVQIVSGATEKPEDDEQLVSGATEMPEDHGQFGSNPPQMQGGNGQPGGNPPQMQGGNGQPGGNPPERPDGNGQFGGNPPEMPEGNGQFGGNPPERPEGEEDFGSNPPEKPDGNGQFGSNPPEMPEGNGQSDGNAPQQPDGNAQGGKMQLGPEMLTVGAEITVTLADDGTAAEILFILGDAPMGGPGGFGGDSASIEYTALNTYAESTELNGESILSTGKDENALLVTDGDVTLTDMQIERNSSDSTGGDNASFYGVGAAVLTTGGTVTLENSNVSTDADGGAGVFAYGSGTAYVSDTTITTERSCAGGVHVAGGGTLYGWDLDVETQGESSAAVRSDRGSGTMVLDGGSYTSNGIGSPAVYSTADITVNNSELTANGSEAVCIEGKNSLRLYDCVLSGNMSDDSRNDCTWNVILYQSMSGDSTPGNSLFEMVGGRLIANNGGVFYTTNTESTFVLKGVEIEAAEDSEFFLKCTGNANQRGWGNAGSNGAQCAFTAIDQSINGNIIWDSISTLDFYMTEGSVLTGAFIKDDTNAGEGGEGYASLNIGEGCTWIVTEDSTLSSLGLSGTITDEDGLTVSVVGTDGTVYISGESELTVTVESFYTAADLTGCSEVSEFSDFAVEKA